MLNLDPEYTPRAVIRRMLLLLVVALVLAFGMAAHADSVRLYDQVGVKGKEVRLKDVAEVKGPAAAKFGDLVIATLQDKRAEYTLTLDMVDQALSAAGVNWGLVSLGGFNECKVTRLIEPASVGHESDRSVVSNIETPIGLHTTLTLRGMVEKHLADRMGADPSEISIDFSERDAEKLNIPILGRRVEFESISTNQLGRVPVTVRLYKGRSVSETIRVSATVKRVMLAVVAAHDIDRGQRFTNDDLQVRQCVIDRDHVTPITDPALAIGQQADTSISAGELVTARSVRPPVLVKRGEWVDVRCFVGGLVIRTVAVASEEGSLDSVIKVRNESSGETFLATVTGRREVVVPLADDSEPESSTAMADNPNQEVTQ